MRKIRLPIQLFVSIVVVLGVVLSVFAEGFEESIENSLGMEFVLIKPGKFLMGSPEDEPGRFVGETQHKVNLTNPFYIQTTEVTQAQWQALMGDNPSSHKRCGDRCPVEQVSWHDVQRFVRKLNQKENTDKYRLPTEAEWEYACRAGSTTTIPTGKIIDFQCNVDKNLTAIAWYCGNSQDRVHPVAEKAPNAWGLYDMLGNVEEWCHDWFGAYPSDEVIDPNGPKEGSYRVMRGGAWFSPARDLRCASRFGSPPPYRFQHIGFRLVITP
ncbi:MAG: formylglycine-generating enzyme family protein [Desulfobacteraceae bacterium]|nr:formylglycine-generating enzyme family protein [Desulfobacteraceae bacterium]